MESNRSNKRKSLAKSKMLKAFYRGGKPKSDSSFESTGYKEAKGGGPPHPTAAVGFVIMKQDQVFPPHHKPKVAFVVPADRNSEYGKLESFYGDGDDEAVDAKAARYISGVQERFRLELINSERNNLQNTQLY